MRASGFLLASPAVIIVGHIYWGMGGAAAGLGAVLLLTGIFMVTFSAFRTVWAATILYTAPYVIAASSLLTTAFPSVSPIARSLVEAADSPGQVFLPALIVLVGLGIAAEHDDMMHRAGWENLTFTGYGLLVALAGIGVGWLVVLGTERTGITVSPMLIPPLILTVVLIILLGEGEPYERAVVAVEVHPGPGSITVECGDERREVPITGWGNGPARIEMELGNAPRKVLVRRGDVTRELKAVARGIDGGILFLLYREEG